MVPFSTLMYPDRVRIRPKTLPQTTGKVATNKDTHGEPGPILACAFRVGNENLSMGLPGNASMVSGTAVFPKNPGCKRDDLIVHDGRDYRVSDVSRKQDQSGYSWVVPWIQVDY